MIDRRVFVGGSLVLAGACARSVSAKPGPVDFQAIRATLGPGAQMGIAAVNTGTGRKLLFDADSRYAMCSTFKVALAAAVLAKVERGDLSLTDEIGFAETDIVPHAPVIEANRARGALSVEALCAAIVQVSDNSAANLLLARIGGPQGLTRFMRGCGDAITRLDRMEPALNSNLPDDLRDTTTPAAMIDLMEALLVRDKLSPASRERLVRWMEQASTGLKRLRAGVPPSWRAGDKTGSGANGANNDIAIAWPPGRAPILIACYQSGGTADLEARNAAHAEVARLVSAELT